jgi:hypothetical protein
VIVIKVQSNMKELMALHNADQKHMRLSAAIALTKTAKAAQEELRKEMEKAFDRPTPYALNSTYVRTANVNRLEAEVGIKDESVKGTPAIKSAAAGVGSSGLRRRCRRTRCCRRGCMPCQAVPPRWMATATSQKARS